MSVKLHSSTRYDITTQRMNTKLVMCIGFMTLKYVIVVQKAQYVQSYYRTMRKLLAHAVFIG